MLEDFTFQSFLQISQQQQTFLNPKTACDNFSKDVSPKDRVKPWFSVAFNIVISYIFSKNFN